MTTAPFHVGFQLFPDVTQLDLTGPYEIFARMPGARVHLVARTREPVRSERGLAILPTDTLADCPPLDLVCVPGGPGVNPLLVDAEVLAFLNRVAAGARYVTSVCTGSLVLGAAGLLKGKRAASHWRARPLLARFGALPVAERVVVDGKVITGGGVTAGIDFALRVVAELSGRAAAEAIQLQVEYDPDPPFDAGSPETAPPKVLEGVLAAGEALQREREALMAKAAAALGEG